MAKFLILLIIKIGFAVMAVSLLYSFLFAKYSSLMENNLPDFKDKITAGKFANALDAHDKGHYGTAFSELNKAVEKDRAHIEDHEPRIYHGIFLPILIMILACKRLLALPID